MLTGDYKKETGSRGYVGWMGEEFGKLQNLTVDRNFSKLDLSVVQALKRYTF